MGFKKYRPRRPPARGGVVVNLKLFFPVLNGVGGPYVRAKALLRELEERADAEVLELFFEDRTKKESDNAIDASTARG